MENTAETTERQRAGAHARALAFERALVRIRWFGILLGLFQVVAYQPAPETFVPNGWQRTAYAALGIFALTNLIVIVALRRRPGEAALGRLGRMVFAADMVGLWTMIVAFDFEEFGATWVILVIATLEGALRYQMRGALVPVALAVPIETAREIVRVWRYDFDFYVSSVTFRVGFAFIIAFVAGTMARNLQRERAEAERHAIELEKVAALEAEARRENARLLTQERATVERLRELDTMKSDFIAIASHELRTPLTAIQGSIKTMQRPDFHVGPKQLEDFVGVLDRQAERLTRLVEDLLVVSRIDAGGVSLRMETVTMSDVLGGVLEELGGTRAQRVAVAIAPTLPRIVSDGQRIGQITRNLVENALKFSREDSTVRLAAYLDAGSLIIEVADDGPGIPEAEIPHIFDRFHQVGGSLRRRADGFGLGLYITKRLVGALGGAITVDSTVGRGSTFRVRLPAALPDEASSDIA